LLDDAGEFISAEDGARLLDIADSGHFKFAESGQLGKTITRTDWLEKHIQAILALPGIDIEAIKKRDFTIVVDAVNSVGGIAVPALLQALGVTQIIPLFCEPDGKFAHNPEPLPENLSAISNEVSGIDADLGIVVDPDVDRLALVNEDGTMFGEEYTLVAVADYMLSLKPGNTVSNLSSTRALQDITEKHGGNYLASAVGEVNVVTAMKASQAVIGGEGNGGVIIPELHYGRDALAGIALFLSHLARFGKSISMLRATYPNYFISKKKIQLTPEVDVDMLLREIQTKYIRQPQNTIDGLRIELDQDWVHLRRSNTEPIIRIYAESTSETTAAAIANKLMEDIRDVIKDNQ
jgi:phosphomannomutase